MHGVTMDSLTLNLTRRRVFDIKFEKADVCYRRLRGMSYREAARTSTGFRAHMEGLVDGVGMERSNSTEVLSEASVAASSAAAPPDCSSAYDQEGISSYVLCCGAKVGQAVVRDHLGTLTEAVDTYADYHSTIDHFPVFNPSPITGLWPYPESSRALRNDGALITMFDSNEPPLAFNRHQPANTVQHEEHGEDEEYELGHASPVMRGRRPRRKAKPPKPSLLALHCKSTCHQYGVRTVTLRAPEGELRFRAAKFHTVWSKIKCSGLQHQPTPPTPTSLCPAFTPTSHPSPPPPPSSSHPTLSFLSSLYSTRPGPSPRMKIQPREGIWAGTYGTHGVEFLLLRYEWGEMTMFNAAAAMAEGEAGADYVPHDNHAYDEGDTTSTRATTAKPHIPTVDMVFYKVTGDVNVPRGEISFRAHLGDGSGSEFVSAPPETVFTTAINASNVSPGNASAAGGAAGGGGGAYKPYAMLSDPSFSDELRGARAYDGDGTVAMSGYRSPTRIRNEGGFFFCHVVVVYGLRSAGVRSG
ncbi:uncharacterized protein EV422DRAFT_214343 [Fimicolochytrium jonesii]|uniref:uncharacterized protein n=1 Tax=Fimicolochytrium jonesii TaxID=1396493 RepID=UPI0022FE448A|nr:uncharacterized protein EV422DRAFT_214343 [Fimicolochytrium jonesii]KAI8817737.1 hypothetical protein EV422DRAFT_214343 [Fimicolochytrium jonesii]